MKEQKAATIKDVAELAGVSIATVSAVINEGSKKVPLSEDARQRVRAAILDLKYQVNTQARMLRTGRSYMIGVIAFDMSQPFTAESIRLIERAALERDYNFLFSDNVNNDKDEGFYLNFFKQTRVEGLLIIGAGNSVNTDAVLSVMADNVPVVITEREVDHIPCILVDNVKGGNLATTHLVAQGYRRIAHLAGPRESVLSAQRYEGYLRALRTSGCDEFEIVEEVRGMTLADGYEAMDRMLDQSKEIQAVFAFNDSIALGAIRAIRDAGMQVPDDIAIVGYDDIPMASYSEPPLTTVHQPIVDMSRMGVELLLDLLEGKYPKGYYAKILLQPELVVRKSS